MQRWCVLMVFLGACVTSVEERPGEVESSSSELDIDLCELLGFYGDGICDEFCPKPDPDCKPDGKKVCAYDEECGYGEVCTAGKGDCLPPPWCKDDWCKDQCHGVCKPKKDDGDGKEKCAYDDECGYGEVCTAYVEDCFPPPWCKEDWCQDQCHGVCKPKKDDGDDKKLCAYDEECGYGERCTAGKEDCEPPPWCKPWEVWCQDMCHGECVPKKDDDDDQKVCTCDDDCGYGKRCTAGMEDCFPPPWCKPWEAWCKDQCHGVCKPKKKPDPNSCVGHCGGQAPGGCFCDDLCLGFGDCCDDFAWACVADDL